MGKTVGIATARTKVTGAVLSSQVLERIPVRGLVLVASVALAYNYSLETLTRGLTLQTPLAYLALVPFIAVLLGAINFRLEPRLRPIHDRQVDWIVGLMLISIAGAIDFLLPSAYTTDFWQHRIDMIGLPFFAAGMIALLYGSRRLWALRWAVMFLFLAWPDPYVRFLATAIGTSTDVALSAVTESLKFLPVAQPIGNATFVVTHNGQHFSLAVGSACSGINSLVGFVILGAAFNTIFKGGILRRILWLAAGLILVGALNVVRIDLIFIAGALMGESFAIDVLHPVAGIIVFGIGGLAMLGIAPLFGLRIPQPPRTEAISTPSRPISDPPSVRHSARHLRVATPMAVGLTIAILLAVPDASFVHYDSLVDAFGSPTLGAIDPTAVTVVGWQSAPSSSFDQATSYFGARATWQRVPFSTTTPTASGVPSSVYLDVIRTDDAGSLSAYGVEACYNFHGYSQVLGGSSDVGAGVQASVASFRSPISGTDWSILWWEWPFNAGGQTRYERLVLLAPLNPTGQSSDTPAASFQTAQATLESLARSIVSAGMNDRATTVTGTLP
jgi:exosortase/archaeosortase family protein